MEVLMGPPFTIKIASSSPYAIDRTGVPPPSQNVSSAASGCSLSGKPPEDGVDAKWNCLKSGCGSFVSGSDRGEVDEHSDSSSSIGNPEDDSDGESVSSTADGEAEEVRSKLNGGFVSMGSLEESLPIKRGLSNHFSGKSKSFVNLTEANTVKDIEKPENPLNKRRRILIASKLAKKSFYNWQNPKSMPMLAVKEEEEDDDDDDRDDEEEKESQTPLFSSENKEDEEGKSKGKRILNFQHRRLMSFNSRSFSLADLQKHHG